jgi:hypothetical protein
MKKIEVDGHTLHRIRALKDFGLVRKGELGGFVESEENLSSKGDCWISGSGCVSGYGRVYDHGWVFGNGRVTRTAYIKGTANITGDGLVASDDDYAAVLGFGTENRSTTFFRCKDGRVRVQCGCFYGTINQFRKRVKKTREDGVAKEYLIIADLMEKRFNRVKW